MTLTPAYGRDYKSVQAVREAYNKGDDFVIADMFHEASGRYVNKAQLLTERNVFVRYQKLTKITLVQK